MGNLWPSPPGLSRRRHRENVRILSSLLSLVLIYRRCTCDVAAGSTWTTSRSNENMRRRQLGPSQSFTAGMPAKLNSTQLRRNVGGKYWDDQCCRPLLFSYRNRIPGTTGGHVAGVSMAYENQAFPVFFILFEQTINIIESFSFSPG